MIFGAALFLASLTACTDGKAKRDKDTLYYGINAPVSNLDPHFALDKNSFTFFRACYEGLVELNPQSLLPVPGCAAKWESLDGNRRFRFYLRPNLKWSNGDPLTAEDFLASWKRVLSPRLQSPHAEMLFFIRNARPFHEGEGAFEDVGVKALDSLTLEVELENPTPFFVLLLNLPCYYPLHLDSISEHGDLDDPENPWVLREKGRIGNGPFQLASWEPSGDIRYKKNDHYHDADGVSLKAIHVRVLPDKGELAEEIADYKLDFCDSVRPEDMPQSIKLPGELKSYPYYATFQLLFNMEKPCFQDIRVRRALVQSVNRKELEHFFISGSQSIRFYTPPVPGGYQFSGGLDYAPEKAREMMAQAGYPDGAGFPTLTLTYNEGASRVRKICEAVKEQWERRLGITVELVDIPWKEYLARLEKGDFDVIRHSWVGEYLDPSSFLNCYISGGSYNYTRFSHAPYDALMKRSRHESDILQRYNLFQEAENLLVQQAPSLPVYLQSQILYVSDRLENYSSNILQYVSFKDLDVREP